MIRSSLKVLPAQLGGRSARSLSLVEKQSLAVSQLLMTTNGCIPIRRVNIGPYLSARAPKVRTSGSLPEESCRRWPISGHAPGTTGANGGFDELLLLLLFLPRHNEDGKRGVTSTSNGVALGKVAAWPSDISTGIFKGVVTLNPWSKRPMKRNLSGKNFSSSGHTCGFRCIFHALAYKMVPFGMV
nr:dynein assembly factor with WDR repeat domains 1 [Ipomoea trifida]